DIFNSPFSAYLNTNYVPTALDRAHIRSLLEEPKAEVEQLDNEIARLQAELDVVQADHDTLEEYIQAHYDLLSPFRRLPDDILREIFLWCLPTTHNALMCSSEPPLLLGRVCSRWRALTFSTPRLWASLHIPLPIPPAQNGLPHNLPVDKYTELCNEFADRFKLHCVAIHDWLTRSGTCLLSLSLNPLDMITSSNRYTEYIKTYLSIILPFSSRWQSLEFSVPSGEISKILASLRPSSLPKLEYLHLKFPRRASPPHDGQWQKSGLLTTRSLRVLQLSLFPFPMSTIEADFSKITHLILADIVSSPRYAHLNRKFTIDETYKLFVRCPNLLHVVIDVIDNAEAYNLHPDPLGLPHLESVTIVDGAQRIDTLLECLDLPSLRVVSYHTTFWPAPFSFGPSNAHIIHSAPRRRSPLITLLSRTSGRVEELIIDIQFFALSDLVECFELVPLLKVFRNRKSRLGISREQARLRSGAHFPTKLRVAKTVLELFVPGSPVLKMPAEFDGLASTSMVPSSSLSSSSSIFSSATPKGLHGEEGFVFTSGTERVLCPQLHTVELKDLQTLSDTDVWYFLHRKLSNLGSGSFESSTTSSSIIAGAAVKAASSSSTTSSTSSTKTPPPTPSLDNTQMVVHPLKEASFVFTTAQELDLPSLLIVNAEPTSLPSSRRPLQSDLGHRNSGYSYPLYLPSPSRNTVVHPKPPYYHPNTQPLPRPYIYPHANPPIHMNLQSYRHASADATDGTIEAIDGSLNFDGISGVDQLKADLALKLDLKYPEPRIITPGNFNPSNGLVKRDGGWPGEIII
ncbi:hypothetical protein CVT26_013903, partial [Gymnopilus dilepis]